MTSIVCTKCLPKRMDTCGQPWSVFQVRCQICDRPKPNEELWYVPGTASDVRFEIWKQVYESHNS